MKKTIALLLVLAMCLSLCACGGNGSDSKSNEPNDKNVQQGKNTLFSTAWVNIYTGSKLVFSEDGTVASGQNTGEWTQDNSTITITYTSAYSGDTIEQYYDYTDKDGTAMLKSHPTGKYNGMTAIFTSEEYYPEDVANDIAASAAKKLGDTVSSDIIELTVKKAALSHYAESPRQDAATGKTTNVDSACEPADGGFFSCSKGRTLLCLDFVLKNTDRDTLDTGNYIVSFAVKQGDNYATAKGYDLNNKDGSFGLNLAFSPIAYNGGDFYTNDTSNELISAGQSAEIKVVCVLGFESVDLSAPFSLIVNVSNSSNGTESFIYAVE